MENKPQVASDLGSDTGVDELLDANRKRREYQERSDNFRRLVNEAGERYATCTLDNFNCLTDKQRRIVSELEDYLAGDCCCGLILYGPVGTGKDHLAFAVLRAAIKMGQRVRWVNGQKWFGMLRDAIDANRDEAGIISEATGPDLLCLSDPLPPVGQLTQYQSTMLYRLVDARYSRGKATVCTINIANDVEADERMGAATWDRLCHDAWKLNCNWASHRQPRREVK